MTSRMLTNWPVQGGLLERFGHAPAEIEARSRSLAMEFVGCRFQGPEAELVAALIYAAGDPDMVARVALGGDPVGRGRAALRDGGAIVADVTMVSAGIRLPAGQRLAVALRAPGAERFARSKGTTRTAAGMKRLWDDFGRGSVVVIGNAPTALLAVLDLAEVVAPPACVIATCPGFTGAAEAKEALIGSGLPHVVVRGNGGGTGLAVAAINALLTSNGAPEDGHDKSGR